MIDLVRRLVAEQFPQWAGLPITPVEPGGWDNRTFRLGAELSVRLPSGDGYVEQVEKEQRWLPVLGAAGLPLPIPTPVARGEPTDEFPRPWSVFRWIDGQVATADRIADIERFAEAVGGFLAALYRVDASAGPAPGNRGGPLSKWDGQVRDAVASLGARVDAGAVLASWDAALSAPFAGPPVWVHGDVSPTNLLLRDGELSAVIDFGSMAVGDPACDLMIAWTFFEGRSRAAFRAAAGVDDAAWERGRGWALWKALLVLDESVHGRNEQPHWSQMGWRTDAATVLDGLL